MNICDDCGTIIWSWIIRNGLITHTYKHDNENRKGTIPVWCFLSLISFMSIFEIKLAKQRWRNMLQGLIIWSDEIRVNRKAVWQLATDIVQLFQVLIFFREVTNYWRQTLFVERPTIWIGNDRFVFRGMMSTAGGTSTWQIQQTDSFHSMGGVE